MASAAPCAANTTSIATGVSCTGPVNWTLGAGTITNNGTISGGGTGVVVTGIGHRLTSLINTGAIVASGTGIQLFSSGAVGTITNDGLLQSPGGNAIAAFAGTALGTIINSGTIFGGVLNRSASSLTIIGASSGFGTFTSASPTKTIENTVTNLVFASGGTVLDMNVNVRTRLVINEGATLKLLRNRTITGSFIQNGGALVLVGTSPSSFSKLVVTGTANFYGGDIVLIPLSGLLTDGDYTVVSATGGVTSVASVSSEGFAATSSIVGGTNLVVTLAALPPTAPPTPPTPTTVDASQPAFTFADPAASGPTIVMAGGTLQTTGTSTSQAFEVLEAGGTIDVLSDNLVLSGPVSNQGPLSLTGAGAVILAGSLINAGTITFDTTGAISGPATNSGVIVVNDGRKVDLTGAVGNAGTITYGGTGTIAGRIDNSGALDIGGGHAVGLAGFITNSGRLSYDATGALVGTIANTGSIDIRGGREVNLAGAITNDGLLTYDATGTIAGTITNTGSINIRGGRAVDLAGALINRGTVTYDAAGTIGGRIENDGVLNIHSGQMVDLGAAVTNAGRITFEGTGMISGAITNTGAVEILGGQKVVLTGAISGGVTTVTSGQLAIDGRVDGIVLQVGAAGVVRGSGVVNAPTAVAGMLAPGNSPGTLTFTKPVGFTDTAILSIDIDGTGTGAGAGNYSRLILQGAPITVAGRLRPVLRGITGSATNTFTPKLGDRFNVIHADGGVTGAFTTLDPPASGLASGTRFDVLYGSKDLDLVVTPSAYGDLSALGLTESRNQRAAGGALDAQRPAAGDFAAQATSVFNALYSLSPDQIHSALDQISGAVHAESLLSGVFVQRQVSTILDERLSSLRAGHFGELRQAGRAGLGAVEYATDGGARPASPPSAASAQGSAVRAWGQVFGRVDRQDFDGNAPKAYDHMGGAVAGADIALDAGPILGLAMSYVHDGLRTKAAAQADLDVVALSLYGAVESGAAFADGQLNGGWARTKSRRRVDFGGIQQAFSGTAEGWNVGASARAGLALSMAGFGVEPSVGFRYDHIDREAVSETNIGDLALRTSALNVDALRSTVMVRIRHEMAVGSARFAPQLRVGWAHELGDRQAVSANSFVSGGAPFEVAGNRLDRDRLLAGFEISATLASNVRFYGDYSLEAGENTRSSAFSAGLRYTW
ncbi:MAG: autotransporter domain-containing protein [Alphaproteobacteria bacterium]|nr:autotransporter domain-containing protein [Alphaproteobacteria bacterium]